MKKTLLFIFCPLIAVGFMAWAYGAAQNARRTPDTDRNESIVVLNPAVANRMATRVPLAPRLDSLNGKTVYMVDINWGGPEAALNIFEAMQAWFAQNMPDVKTVIRIKKGGYETDDPALWKEIGGGKGNAAILGVSG